MKQTQLKQIFNTLASFERRINLLEMNFNRKIPVHYKLSSENYVKNSYIPQLKIKKHNILSTEAKLPPHLSKDLDEVLFYV